MIGSPLRPPALDEPQLRSHRHWRAQLSRVFAAQHRHCRPKLQEDVSRCSGATRCAAALVRGGDKSSKLATFSYGRGPDFAFQRLVKRRSKQLQLQRPSAAGALARQLLNSFLSQFDQISRDHALHPFVAAPFAPSVTDSQFWDGSLR